jgi:tetratricopeptide (TPR) repeat protein
MSKSRFGTSVLIVDYKLDELSRLRDIVSGLGFEHVEAAASVNMAVSYLREMTFDIVFVAYDMGKTEKNGLQVVQEALAEKLRLFQTRFILIIDAASSSLLVGSLESAPDAYVARPYDRAKIQNLLEKLQRVKKAVYSVEEAMDGGKWDRALELNVRLIDVYPGLKVYLERLQGVCLLELGRYQEAEALFSQLVASRKQVWAQVGQGMSCYFLGRHQDVIKILQQVVDQQHISVEAFSWLARSMHVCGDLSQSIVLMRKAVMLQPAVPQLQSEMGNLAVCAQEWTLAVGAFRAALKYSRYSVFQNPDHYFSLVRCLIVEHQAKKGSQEDLELEAMRAMEDVVRDSSDDISVQFRAHIVISELRKTLGNNELAEAELLQAIELFSQLSISDQWRWLDWVVDAGDSGPMTERVRLLRSRLLQAEGAPAWVAFMKEGLQKYKKRDLSSAAALFRQADAAGAESVTLILNLAQVEIELKAKANTDQLLHHWATCLLRMDQLNFGAFSMKQHNRFKALFQRYSDIQIKMESID